MVEFAATEENFHAFTRCSRSNPHLFPVVPFWIQGKQVEPTFFFHSVPIRTDSPSGFSRNIVEPS
jgi:hypothetical protein